MVAREIPNNMHRAIFALKATGSRVVSADTSSFGVVLTCDDGTVLISPPGEDVPVFVQFELESE